MGLTLKRIARANKPGRYADGHNLYLQVGRSGTKSWLLRYVLNGRERWMGLGKLADFNLEEARERAKAARQLLADGTDPLEARKAERAAKALEAARSMTFAAAADAYYKTRESSWRSARHQQQWRSSMRDYVLPKIGPLAVADIDIGQVRRCVEPHWRDKAITMMRVRSRIEAVLAWATVWGYRQGDNPARWRGNLEKALPAPSKVAPVEHHTALPYAELPAFMSELAALPGVVARALEFLILTAARTAEVTGARWDEIDIGKAVWAVPAERMKAGREHRVPLSARAVELLAALPREADWVFPSPARAGAPISDSAMLRTLRRRLRSDIVPHGFRSTFSDWGTELTNFPHRMIEMALAHQVGNETERAYRRTDLFDKRRKLMEMWAGFAYSPPPAGVVVPLKRAQ
ncbi:MAG: integrase arm-type DNA-binding domain-containing protein [Rhodoplanes sp.]